MRPLRYHPDMAGRLPESMRWLFWDVVFDDLDPELQADAVLARVLENGRQEDVRALLTLYGADLIHEFFLRLAHPLVSARTRAFWRAYFKADDEPWATPPAFRTRSSAPWID
jgi:hypothetical protein